MTDPREAKIEAVWPQYEVKDLNLSLKAGGPPAFVSKMRADLSKDLAEANRLGAVRVSWVKRCLVSKPPKPPAPPSARRIKPAPRKQAVEQPLDEDAIADKVAAKLMGNLDQRDAQLRKELREMVANGGTVDTDRLAELLATGIAEKLPAPQQVVVQQGGGQVVGQTASDDPHYIPSKIIPSDAKANIQASKTKSDAGQTDDAAAKLAALRRKKKENSNE